MSVGMMLKREIATTSARIETVEAALTACKTQDEFDAWHASQEGGELTMTTN